MVHAKTQPQNITTDAVIWGTVNEYQQQVQVFMQLQMASDDSVLWAQQFESSRDQVYQLQNRIVEGLLSKLNRKQSVNAFAQERSFEQYLLARHLWQQRTVDALEQAQRIYEQMRDDDQRSQRAHRQHYGDRSAAPSHPQSAAGTPRLLPLPPGASGLFGGL